MVDLRGVGKIVLLDRARRAAEEVGLRTIWIEAPENRSLPATLAPQLRMTLIALSRNEKAKALAQRALRALAGFVGALTPQPPVRLRDVEAASDTAIAALDESFFRVRFDRLAPSQRGYLRAMAELGAGPHRSGDIAQVLGKTVSTYAPLRAKLIEKGVGVEPESWGHRFHRPALRRVHAPDHAERRLAGAVGGPHRSAIFAAITTGSFSYPRFASATTFSRISSGDQKIAPRASSAARTSSLCLR